MKPFNRDTERRKPRDSNRRGSSRSRDDEVKPFKRDSERRKPRDSNRRGGSSSRDSGKRGGSGRRPSFNRREGTRSDRFDRRDSRRSSRIEMHTAICDKCGKDCEVPFKPTSNKPIYCSDCFKKEDIRPKDNSSIELEEINEKLDKIIKALKIKD